MHVFRYSVVGFVLAGGALFDVALVLLRLKKKASRGPRLVVGCCSGFVSVLVELRFTNVALAIAPVMFPGAVCCFSHGLVDVLSLKN
jgi:hypothetical protein